MGFTLRPLKRAQDLYRALLRSKTQDDVSMASAAAVNFLSGAAAGCSTLIIIYPLDIAHTRLAADVGNSSSREFNGIYHFLRTIFLKEGFRGVYRGLPASLQGMIVHRGIYFGGFDTAKEMMAPAAPLWQRWAAAQAVTSAAGMVSYPLDTVRRRMMMQSGAEERMYGSTIDCWRKIFRNEGVGGFYRGTVSHLFRSTGAAAILVMYDEVRKFMHWGGI